MIYLHGANFNKHIFAIFMKKILLFSLLGFIFLTGCRLDSPVIPSDIAGNTGGVVTDPTDANSYLTVTKNNILTYQQIEDGDSYEIKRTNTGNKITVENRIFYEVLSANALFSEQIYFSKQNGIYILRSENLVNNQNAELEYLKDNASVGDTWVSRYTDEGMFGNLPCKSTTTVIEKNITKTVINKSYTSVYHTKVITQFRFEGDVEFKTLDTYDFYIAKGIGIIQIDLDNLSGQSSTQLKSYIIK